MIDLDDTIVEGGYLDVLNEYMGTNYTYSDTTEYFVESLLPEDRVDEYTKQLEYQLKEKDKKITELENILKPILDLNIPINTLINEFERLNELEDNMEISKLKSKDKKV